MRALRKIAVLIAIILGVNVVTPFKPVEAASTGQILAYSAVAIAYYNIQIKSINNNQPLMLREYQKQSGVLENSPLDARLGQIMERLSSSGMIHNKYEWYLTPSKEFNAACGFAHVIQVNKGTMDVLDDDELAAVLGHELRHGEADHNIKGVQQALGLNVIVNLFLVKNENYTSQLLTGVATRAISAEVFSMEHEREADRVGYDYYVAAGYNPGAMSASFIKMRAMYGDMWSDGVNKVLNPVNHPKTTDRINSAAAKMYAYSGGHVSVKGDKIVQINGQNVVAPVKAGRYLAEERAYLVAGNLARVYHENALDTAIVGDDGAVYIGSYRIIIPQDGDTSAQEIADRINQITGK